MDLRGDHISSTNSAETHSSLHYSFVSMFHCFTDAAGISHAATRVWAGMRLAPSFLMKCSVPFWVCWKEYDLLISAVCGSKWHGMRKAFRKPCGRKCKTETIHHWQLMVWSSINGTEMHKYGNFRNTNLDTILKKNGKVWIPKNHFGVIIQGVDKFPVFLLNLSMPVNHELSS